MPNSADILSIFLSSVLFKMGFGEKVSNKVGMHDSMIVVFK